ncbi:hypothetical protein HMPREF3103_08785 [Granulicatella sp. HMSC30F09]|uniref:hypothetical protein n=1 Tax=Granulicatella sp. HMSC30F09 TaxID=1581071 RepID=UPI0008C47576|nr:hypothetical protein [Granulicatella sp. HMSC30F09]OFT78502.1 hypothetical protein HMPREF3103_08785 [Granulicatella sp. HMSC30F09]
MKIFILTVFSVLILVVIVNYKTKSYWKNQANIKWKEIQPDIKELQMLHKDYFQDLKGMGVLDNLLFKTTKTKFNKIKANYYDYVDFCKSKNVPVNSKHDNIASMIEETEWAIMNPKELINNLLKRAQKNYDKEYESMMLSGEGLLEERQNSIALISEIEELINTIAKRPKSFDVALEEIKVEKTEFQSRIDYANLERENLKKGAKGMGIGVAVGSAVAGVAPTTALWVATTFGTASTGTAISALSGAAATNAALAWLGGGTLASGGGGMLAGQALLALAGPIGWGVTAGGILVGIFLFIKKKFKIQEEKKEEIKRIKQFTESLQEVRLKIEQIKVQTVSIHNLLLKQLEDCLEFANVDYSTITSRDKKRLGTLVNNTTSLSLLLGKTLEESK